VRLLSLKVKSLRNVAVSSFRFSHSGFAFSAQISFIYDIKTSYKKYSKLTGRIIQASKAVSNTPIAAIDLAYFGKELSIWESVCKRLYNIHWLMKNIESKAIQTLHEVVGKEKLRQQTEKNFNNLKSMISDIFVEALLNHDKKTIIELAKAAAFFKGKIGLFQEQEPVCAKLLQLKATFPIHKGKTMREIAEFVYGGKTKPSADGYSHLRKLCKNIGLQIKPSRAQSTKKKNYALLS
jgi:hypothetical protein